MQLLLVFHDRINISGSCSDFEAIDTRNRSVTAPNTIPSGILSLTGNTLGGEPRRCWERLESRYRYSGGWLREMGWRTGQQLVDSGMAEAQAPS